MCISFRLHERTKSPEVFLELRVCVPRSLTNLADLIVAETVYVLESFYRAPRDQFAAAMRSLIAMRSMITLNPALLLRAIEVYEGDRLDFAEAYHVACAETAGVGTIASFDEAIDRGHHRDLGAAGAAPAFTFTNLLNAVLAPAMFFANTRISYLTPLVKPLTVQAKVTAFD